MIKKDNKKTIKIDFRHFWPNFNKDNNFFTNLLKEKYKVVISNNPDYVFFSVFGEEFKTVSKKSSFIRTISPKLHEIIKKSIFWEFFKNSKYGKKHYQKKMPFIEGSFVKIFYTPENIIPDMSKCDWAFGFEYEDKMNNPRYFRLPYYVFEDINLLKKLLNKKVEKKLRFCNFIYSNECYSRNRFFKMLNKYKRVDAPGKCMNNMPSLDAASPTESRNKINWQDTKLNFIKKYKFTIAFENSVSEGYTTEKITQPMSVGSIPIYFGNPKIKEEFNEKAFINVGDFKNFKQVIKRIKEIDSEKKEYVNLLAEPWFKDNMPNKYFDKQRYLDIFREVLKK
jgi:hypothetical protein